MYFENVISLDDTVNPTVRQHLTGKFQTNDKWGMGDLELNLSEKGTLTGSLTLEDITFGLKGLLSHTGDAFGYLLEPDAAIPIAMLRIKTYGEGLSLEFHVPEFTNLMDESKAEPVLFSRAAKNTAVATDMLEDLLIGAWHEK
jgi:hypothetical protein